MRHWFRTSQLQLRTSHEALPARKHGYESPSTLKQMSINYVLQLMAVVYDKSFFTQTKWKTLHSGSFISVNLITSTPKMEKIRSSET